MSRLPLPDRRADRRIRLSRPGPPAWPRSRQGLSAGRGHIPLCLILGVTETRPDVRRRAGRGSRPDGDAGSRIPRRGVDGSRAMTCDRTRTAEWRFQAGTRGRAQCAPPSGASTPPGASGASALRSAADWLDNLGMRSRSKPGSRVNSASSRLRRLGVAIGSRALCSSLVCGDCRIGG